MQSRADDISEEERNRVGNRIISTVTLNFSAGPISSRALHSPSIPWERHDTRLSVWRAPEDTSSTIMTCTTFIINCDYCDSNQMLLSWRQGFPFRDRKSRIRETRNFLLFFPPSVSLNFSCYCSSIWRESAKTLQIIFLSSELALLIITFPLQ